MTRFILFLFAFISVEIVAAQHAYFANRGTISFDKITYTRARMRQVMGQIPSTRPGGGMGGFGGRDVNEMPESTTQKMTLLFDEQSSLLSLNPDDQSSTNTNSGRQNMGGGNRGGNRRATGFGAGNSAPRPNMRNTQKVLYQNLKNLTAEIQIEIDEKYLLTDSLSKITWRFTDEYREIAGYDCRRVNGSTPDSLYVIGYYTDQIPVSAGPALSHGLPGMILGLVIPEMHIHYWATKVEYTTQPVSSNDWKEKKVKSMSLNEFSNSFGQYFQRSQTNDSNKRRIFEQLIY